MTKQSWWRPAVALIAFVLWAHPSLLGLPLAALLIVAPAPPERARWAVPLAGLIGAMSLALLFIGDGTGGSGGGGRLAAVTSAYIVVITAAFVAVMLLQPGPMLRQALRATAAGFLVTALMIEVLWGTEAWSGLAWEATRQASLTMRFVVERAPDAFMLYEPIVRFASVTWPGVLALQTLAGLALAWHLHLRITTSALGSPLGRFRDFCIGDAWFREIAGGFKRPGQARAACPRYSLKLR